MSLSMKGKIIKIISSNYTYLPANSKLLDLKIFKGMLPDRVCCVMPELTVGRWKFNFRPNQQL